MREVEVEEVEEVEHQGGKTRPTASEGAKRERSTQAHMLDNTVVEPCSGFNSWPMIWNIVQLDAVKLLIDKNRGHKFGQDIEKIT